jgi:uncharacterized protein YcfJ
LHVYLERADTRAEHTVAVLSAEHTAWSEVKVLPHVTESHRDGTVGRDVGDGVVGSNVGRLVGRNVGCGVGDVVGWHVGRGVGALVGDGVVGVVGNKVNGSWHWHIATMVYRRDTSHSVSTAAVVSHEVKLPSEVLPLAASGSAQAPTHSSALAPN